MSPTFERRDESTSPRALLANFGPKLFAPGALMLALAACSNAQVSPPEATPVARETPETSPHPTARVAEVPVRIVAPEAPACSAKTPGTNVAPLPTTVVIRPGANPPRMAGIAPRPHHDSEL